MIVLSGMRPTGRLHFGHYFGALKTWLELQKCDQNKCYYMSADWHALTTDYANTSKIHDNILEMVADWIAVGIDPKKSIIFQQSMVHQHIELFLILSMFVPLGWLYRCPTYKDQIKEIKNRNLNNYGFLGYPVLMSADILLYMTDIVPIGEDQLPHLEFTRDIVKRFNYFYSDNLFHIPNAKLTKTARVLGLDGRKMSKSYNNTIFLTEDIDTLYQKINKMITDPTKIKQNDIGHPKICVVFSFIQLFYDKTKQLNIQNNCEQGLIGCVKCKHLLMEILSEFIKPLNSKRKYLLSDKTYLVNILKTGSDKASNIADKTIKRIHKILKF
ncbi:MAG: tryptophan--tRNA ligase [Endomicrobium sp.]|jgi:tryptophanyl-tRNA synthetase|nr:tryptophan--tRNA ligase [Endomicrobium sp.]